MPNGKALTNIPEMDGKAYAAGAKIPAAVIAKITPQVLRSLVDGGKIEVEGMEQSAGGSGGQAHIMARLDQQSDQIKALVAGCKTLTDRVISLEGGKVPTKKSAANKRSQ